MNRRSHPTATRAIHLRVAARVCVAILSLAFATSVAAQDRADAVKDSSPLRWGADQEGGAPFLFGDPADITRMTGFEVDLAAELQREIGRPLEFRQAQWDLLPSMLLAGKIDLVMNGYERTADRLAVMDASLPYYAYALQLLVNEAGPIDSWEGLKRGQADGSPWRLGVLTGSAAEDYLREFQQQGGAVTYASYDGVTDAMREVETGKLDATLQDTPVASFYARDFPRLRAVGDPVAPGHYVIYVRRGEETLLRAINRAIVSVHRDGTLRRICERYGIWTAGQGSLAAIIDQAEFFGVDASNASAEPAVRSAGQTNDQAARQAAGAPAESSAGFPDAPKLLGYAKLLGGAALLTISLAVVSFPLAVAVGVLVAVGRLYGSPWLRRPLGWYVEFLRGTPLMLQLYFIFYLLPEVGINIPAIPTAILGLAINYSAYESEIYRAGLQAVPRGQWEAALSLGMSRAQTLRRIVLPQAFKVVIPPMVNDFIALFKDTSVCSVVTIVELTKRFSILSRSNVADLVILMGFTALLYLAMSYPMSVLARRIERRLEGETRP
jgi:polar amino acid transport system substrate-binding protein